MRNDYLVHWGFKKGAQKEHHKYVARVELPNGGYRYFYTLPEYAAYLKGKAKDKIDETKKNINEAIENRDKIASKALNKVADAGNKLYDKVVTTNKYITDDYSYDRKKQQIQQTQEWKDIKARKDPEYRRVDKEGNVTYDIDSYLAKKKHPVLDAMDDFIAGREISVNKVTKESAIAGAYDYAKTYIQMCAIGTEFLLEKFKFSQGSYKEQKQQIRQEIASAQRNATKQYAQYQQMMNDPSTQKAISDGEKFIKEYGSTVRDVSQDIDKIQSKASQYVSDEDIKKAKKEYENAQKKYEKVMKELEEYEAKQREKEEKKNEK